MSAIPIDWKPDRRKLREFALISLMVFGLLGTVIAYKSGCFQSSGKWTAPVIVWLLGVWGLLGAFAPPLVKPLYTGLMAVTFPIGWVISHLLLGLIYYGMFTPLALFFRLVGRDALKLKIDRNAASYWIETPTNPDSANYFRQF